MQNFIMKTLKSVDLALRGGKGTDGNGTEDLLSKHIKYYDGFKSIYSLNYSIIGTSNLRE